MGQPFFDERVAERFADATLAILDDPRAREGFDGFRPVMTRMFAGATVCGDHNDLPMMLAALRYDPRAPRNVDRIIDHVIRAFDGIGVHAADRRALAAETVRSDGPRIVHIPPIESFGRLEPDKWLPLKTLEEAAELVEATKQCIRTDPVEPWAADPARRRAMLDELADVLQTCANLAVAFRISDDELAESLDRCRERNRRRGRL